MLGNDLSHHADQIAGKPLDLMLSIADADRSPLALDVLGRGCFIRIGGPTDRLTELYDHELFPLVQSVFDIDGKIAANVHVCINEADIDGIGALAWIA